MSRALGVTVAPGFTRTNLIACWFLGMTATMVITFLPTAQPYILSGCSASRPEGRGGWWGCCRSWPS